MLGLVCKAQDCSDYVFVPVLGEMALKHSQRAQQLFFFFPNFSEQNSFSGLQRTQQQC